MGFRSAILLLLLCNLSITFCKASGLRSRVKKVKSLMVKSFWHPNDIAVRAGHFSMQGQRRTMEDTYTLVVNFRSPSSHHRQSFFAVYDGHGGAQCAKYCSKHLYSMLFMHPDLLSNPVKALNETVEQISRDFLEFHDSDSDAFRSGSTAIVAYRHADKLYVANVGDSRAVLGLRSGNFQDLSQDHKPYRKDEKLRIEAAGGRVRQPMHSSILRVHPGSIAITRSIGDGKIKECGSHLCSTPEIEAVQLTKNDDFLILACDGVWDVLSSAEAVKIIQLRKMMGDDPASAAEYLADIAYNTKKSTDNISVLVVYFNP